jgi:Caspase domain
MIAIFAGAIAAMGNSAVSFFNSEQERQLEAQKAEQTRILEMIKTGDPDKAAQNLEFLVNAGLVDDSTRKVKLEKYLSERKPGAGPSLASASVVDSPISCPINWSAKTEVPGDIKDRSLLSLNIGLNAVDSRKFGGAPPLAAAVADSLSMQAFAKKLNFSTLVLNDAQANKSCVLSHLRYARSIIKDNGVLIITFSGFGTQMTDLSKDEADRLDETVILYDDMITDDDFAEEISLFEKSSTIVVMSDVPHGFDFESDLMEISRRKFLEDSSFVFPNIIMISGAREGQQALDGVDHGQFTGVFLKIFEANSRISYVDLLKKIASEMPADQQPKLFSTNGSESKLAFEFN